MMVFNKAGWPGKEQTRKITDIPCENGSQRFVLLPPLIDTEGPRYTDRDMHPKILKAQQAHGKKPSRKRR